jgi:hypothetical protein
MFLTKSVVYAEKYPRSRIRFLVFRFGHIMKAASKLYIDLVCVIRIYSLENDTCTKRILYIQCDVFMWLNFFMYAKTIMAHGKRRHRKTKLAKNTSHLSCFERKTYFFKQSHPLNILLIQQRFHS